VFLPEFRVTEPGFVAASPVFSSGGDEPSVGKTTSSGVLSSKGASVGVSTIASDVGSESLAKTGVSLGWALSGVGVVVHALKTKPRRNNKARNGIFLSFIYFISKIPEG
jgi:hypothetical protein